MSYLRVANFLVGLNQNAFSKNDRLCVGERFYVCSQWSNPGLFTWPDFIYVFVNDLPLVFNGDALMAADDEKLINPHLDYAVLQADFHGIVSLTQAWDLPLNESRHGIINVGHSLSVRHDH